MQIDNLIINASLIDILTELRQQLAMQGIKRFEKMFDSGTDIMVQCPYHKNGQERKPSAGIRKSDGVIHCLACGETHSLPEMISYCFNSSDVMFGYKWLSKNFVNVEVSNRDNIVLDFSRNNRNVNRSNNVSFVTDEELDKYRYTHKYLYERGLNDSVIELFDVGYDVESDSITFPVKDKQGNCLFIARRSVRTKRFDLPKDLEKPLYGLYEAGYASKGEYNIDISSTLNMRDIAVPYLDSVYVCEGLFDCLRLWCNGKIAVAGFGCLFSDYQMKQLRELPTRKLILALDNDKAGREGAERIRGAVKNKLITEVIIPNGKKDIGELTDNEINNLEEVF